MNDSENLASRIRTLRKQARMTQADLSAIIGVSRSHLSKIETSDDLPGRETLAALATHFHVSLDWLAEGRGDARPARATTEEEALLLFAFRRMPEKERAAHLQLMLTRMPERDA